MCFYCTAGLNTVLERCLYFIQRVAIKTVAWRSQTEFNDISAGHQWFQILGLLHSGTHACALNFSIFFTYISKRVVSFGCYTFSLNTYNPQMCFTAKQHCFHMYENEGCFINYSMDFTYSVLHLNQLSDSGIYTCVAASSSGETSWSAFLEVRGKVLFKQIFIKKCK